jgi:hypothetical protein
MKPSKCWIEQCAAAQGIEDQFGTANALDYLIGEKFLNFLEAAEDNPEFRAEIPATANNAARQMTPMRMVGLLIS